MSSRKLPKLSVSRGTDGPYFLRNEVMRAGGAAYLKRNACAGMLAAWSAVAETPSFGDTFSAASPQLQAQQASAWEIEAKGWAYACLPQQTIQRSVDCNTGLLDELALVFSVRAQFQLQYTHTRILIR